MAPSPEPEPFSQELDRLFTRLFDQSSGSPQRWVPAMDLTEADDHFVLKADLPGLSDEDVSIEVQDNTLTISGERKAEHMQREKGWHRIERSFGRFKRGACPTATRVRFNAGVRGAPR